MNKKIITIIAVFFSILFVDNVKAWSSSDYINVNYDGSFVQEKMSEYSEFINFMDNNIIDKLNNDSYDYFINLNRYGEEDFQYCVTQKYNKSDIFYIRSLFWYGASGLETRPNDLNKRYYCYSYNDFINNAYTSDNIYSFLENSSFSTSSSMFNYAYIRVKDGTTDANKDIYIEDNIYKWHITSIMYYSNTDIIVSDMNCDSGEFVPITFNGDNKSYAGDKFYTYLDVMDKTPTITFSVSENKETINGEEIVTSKDLTVNFSIIDNTNYRYLISFDRENWSSITIDEGNSMTFNIKENKTVYVQVLNASDYSMVTSATYTIDGIIDKPSIYYNIISEDKVPESEKVYIVSKTLRTTFDIIDNEKYVYAYSLDGENWKKIKLVNGIKYFDLKFNQNETVRTKILDRNTGDLITSSSFTVGGITGYESSDGVIYKNLLKIPISDLYESGTWKKYQFVFMSNTENTYNYDIRIELVPRSDINDNKPIPLQIYMGQEISDIKEYQEKIQNSPTSDPDGYGGGFTMNSGSFGGGGGGGRFDENDTYQSCSTFPITESSTFKSKLNYKVVTILTNSCSDISSLTPSDFTTEYIYIYYNARMYESVEDAIDDNLNIDVPTDSIFYDNIIKPIIELINKKMPIITQLKNILYSFQYVEENDSPPQFNIDLTPIGIPYNGTVIDFTFYAQYRDTIFFWIKFIFAYKTLIKILNIVKNMFGGGY